MPHKPIQIIEITRQASQGRSEPYLCVGEDGLNYYVKGRQSGLPTRINEWICAHLGRAIGLPIPDFRLAEITSELLGVTSAKGSCTLCIVSENPVFEFTIHLLGKRF